MADNFGLKIGLEGEKEFKKSLSEINSAFKVLGSEMKLVESQFDKNDSSVEALTARNTALEKSIEAQKQKIETLLAALANAAESFGENDKRTQNWQIQLNNAEAALNGMERELKDNNEALSKAENGMDDAGEAADEMGDKIDDAGDSAGKSESKFSGLGTTLKAVGAAMGAVVVAAAAGAVKLGKEVVSAYADYEQLVGGIDTLFKDSSLEMQRYAANAYKTAGMSANDYMETVTGFSASLISSLGGDTEKAAKYADMAITDMSDNANKMDSDMESITVLGSYISRISCLRKERRFTNGLPIPMRYIPTRSKSTSAASRFPIRHPRSGRSSPTPSSPVITTRRSFSPSTRMKRRQRKPPWTAN